MKTTIEGINIWIPTRHEINAIRIGDRALDCFGHERKVVAITALADDIHGKRYICYYTEFGAGRDGSRISNSAKESQLSRTLATSNRFTSTELDMLEVSLTMSAEDILKREG